jgi:hypothetical protein
MKPRFFVEQKITAWINRYQVFYANETGEKSELAAFVEQKRGRLKEKVLFYSSQDKKDVVFTFRAEKVLDIRGKYFVEDTSGQLIGYFQKDFEQSLVKSTWHVYDANDTRLITVTESNATLALMRRYLGFIPIIGEFFELFIAFFRYHFVFLQPNTTQEVGSFEKLTIFRDKYRLSMDDPTYGAVDQRLIIAMAVALDALQAR